MGVQDHEESPFMGHDDISTSYDGGAQMERGETPEVEWKPGKKEYAVMLTLALISLMVALDATILVSVLPVSEPILKH